MSYYLRLESLEQSRRLLGNCLKKFDLKNSKKHDTRKISAKNKVKKNHNETI
jgi:NADH:ubiquinone oxidoreductase subunit D